MCARVHRFWPHGAFLYTYHSHERDCFFRVTEAPPEHEQMAAAEHEPRAFTLTPEASLRTALVSAAPYNSEDVEAPDDTSVSSAVSLLRDRILKGMLYCESLLFAIQIIGFAAVGIFGVYIVVLLFPVLGGVGVGLLTEGDNPACNISQYNASLIVYAGSSQYPPIVKGHAANDRGYVADHCTHAQFWFNVSIKIFAFVFSYVDLLPLPWSLAVWHDVYFKRRGVGGVRVPAAGVDFYGRNSESLWFCLDVRTRKTVTTLTLYSLISQILTMVFHIVYPTYIEGQTFPGAPPPP